MTMHVLLDSVWLAKGRVLDLLYRSTCLLERLGQVFGVGILKTTLGGGPLLTGEGSLQRLGVRILLLAYYALITVSALFNSHSYYSESPRIIL